MSALAPAMHLDDTTYRSALSWKELSRCLQSTCVRLSISLSSHPSQMLPRGKVGKCFLAAGCMTQCSVQESNEDEKCSREYIMNWIEFKNTNKYLCFCYP